MKNKISIKNYASLLNLLMPLRLAALFIILYVIWKYIKILAMDGGEIKYTFYASIIAMIFFVSDVFDTIKNFKKNPPVFIFDENQITYDYYKNDYRYRHVVKQNIEDIVSIRHILHSEAPYQYGAVYKKSLVKRFFKDDIGDNFIHLIAHFLGFISLLINLPIKILILFYNKEPLSLLYKNLFIEFNDGTAMIINIYREKDYEEISKIMHKNDKTILKDMILNIYLRAEK